MTKLISNDAQAEISKRVKDILCAYAIDDWQSEPYHKHQNFAERMIWDLKANMNKVMNYTGAPEDCWLLCTEYVASIMNHMALDVLDWRTPLEKLTGQTPDISCFMRFMFYEPVYYRVNSEEKGFGFPSSMTEKTGRFVGIADNVGHIMTYKILDDVSRKVIYRSRIRSALDENQINKRAEDFTKDKVGDKEYMRS